MLGTSLLPLLDDAGHSVLASDIRLLDRKTEYLDVREQALIVERSQEYRPDIIIHLAAETDLEVCESNPDNAWCQNYIGTQNACHACNLLDIPIVYISTAGVFDGEKSEPYTEFDSPNPINAYGLSKYEGEKIVRQTVDCHYIVRAGWMIGGGERDKKFVHKIITQLREGASVIRAVNDKSGSPTYAPAFSKMLLRIITEGAYGTYHLTCKGRATRYDVASHILNTLGRSDVKLEAVRSDYFKDKYFAPRPRSEEMRNYILDLKSMNHMPDWSIALDEYLKTYFKEDFM